MKIIQLKFSESYLTIVTVWKLYFEFVNNRSIRQQLTSLKQEGAFIKIQYFMLLTYSLLKFVL